VKPNRRDAGRPSGAGLCAAPSFDCVAPGADAPGTDDDDDDDDDDDAE
jgi:hypothetical protein